MSGGQFNVMTIPFPLSPQSPSGLQANTLLIDHTIYDLAMQDMKGMQIAECMLLHSVSNNTIVM